MSYNLLFYTNFLLLDLHGEVDDKYNSDIEQVGQKQFRTSFLVASKFYEPIRGTNGATQNRIESETNTKISLPRVITVRRGERGDIVITGVTREAVGLARRRVDSAILDAREGLRIDHPMLDARRGRRVDSAMPAARRLTHFTCVPTQSNIKDKFLEFKVHNNKLLVYQNMHSKCIVIRSFLDFSKKFSVEDRSLI